MAFMAEDAHVNYHVEYPDVYRYWSAGCERYAGGDSLVTMLRGGWQIVGNTIQADEYWHAGTRPVTVFLFDLEKGDERMRMPVITNPYVRRVIRMHQLTVKRTSEQQSQRT